MFQAFIDVKTSGVRETVELLPTYNRLEENDYAAVKITGQIPISLYFPEKSIFNRYSVHNSHFKGEIDGWPYEGPFASLLHDIYHALREIQMTEKIATARFRLALIAQASAADSKKKFKEYQLVSNKLIDGELIFSYPVKDLLENRILNIFKSLHQKSEKFGEIFYCYTLKSILSPKLKKIFIEDMVANKNEWQYNFGIDVADLCEEDQKIYRAINKV